MIQRWKRIVAGLVTVLIFAMTGCGPEVKEGQKGKVDVRIAYFPNITHTQALVMKNQGLLEEKWKDTYNVKWLSFNAGPAEIEAIFAGEIDIGYIGPVPALSANVKSNGEVKILSNATNAGAVFLRRKDSGIQSIQDLAGKKVAVPQLGNTQHLCLLGLLHANGLQTRDKGGSVNVSTSSNADILNLIDSARIDAAFVPEPWGTTIEAKGNADVFLDYDKVFWEGNYPSALVVVSEDFLDGHPDIVKSFLQAHEEATQIIHENKDRALDIVNKEIQQTTGKAIDTGILKKAFTRIKVDTRLNRDAIMEFAKLSEEEGFIRKVPEVEDVFADTIR